MTTKKKMNRFRVGLLAMLFLTPLTTFAHGEEALVPLIVIEVVRLIGLVIFMIVIDLNTKGKLILGLIYILTIVLAYRLVGHLPFNEYGTTINSVLLFGPIVLTTFGYWGLRRKFKRSTD